MNPERVCYGCFQEKEPGSICPYCGFDENEEKPYLALPLGTILNGRYMTGKVLGIGGFGITYLGYDLTLEIKVAIKEYMPSALATRHADQYSVVLTGRVETDYRYGMERFLDEARILAKLQNTPHIVSVQNYFKENNTAYFVMEYIDGMSLKEYLTSQGDSIPYGQAMTILQPVMEALEQVHALNLLHRDISPDNIYITSAGESRLLDFGAARFAMGDGKSVSVILKHGYAPEEQYSSHGNQGPWTDVYAMGATLYRCVTGVLPPDSIERIHGDTLKKPSELGVRLPANAENAIVKALALKPENRFSNMSEFILALNGRASVQHQVAASINQKTQAAAMGSPRYAGKEAGRSARSAIARFMAYLKTNPMIAWALGGGLAAVIALCVILPIALSSGDKAPAADASPSQTTSPAFPSSQPKVAAASAVEHDLGIYSATICVPQNYAQEENTYSFIDSENQRLVALIDYAWQFGGPVYSLADVESNRERIVNELMQQFELNGAYSILAAGPDTVGNQAAYQIYFSVADDGERMDVIIEAIEGRNDFGCYFLIGCYLSGDVQGQTEVYEAIASFRCKGPIDISYGVVSDAAANVKVICDTSLIRSTKSSTFTLPNGKSGTAMLLYFSSDDDLFVEVETGTAAGANAGACISYLCEIWRSVPGAVFGETQTATLGNIVWQLQDISYDSYSISIAAADINGTPYLVGVTTDQANQPNAATLFADILSTVRPVS